MAFLHGVFWIALVVGLKVFLHVAVSFVAWYVIYLLASLFLSLSLLGRWLPTRLVRVHEGRAGHRKGCQHGRLQFESSWHVAKTSMGGLIEGGKSKEAGLINFTDQLRTKEPDCILYFAITAQRPSP